MSGTTSEMAFGGSQRSLPFFYGRTRPGFFAIFAFLHVMRKRSGITHAHLQLQTRTAPDSDEFPGLYVPQAGLPPRVFFLFPPIVGAELRSNLNFPRSEAAGFRFRLLPFLYLLPPVPNLQLFFRPFEQTRLLIAVRAESGVTPTYLLLALVGFFPLKRRPVWTVLYLSAKMNQIVLSPLYGLCFIYLIRSLMNSQAFRWFEYC